MLTVHLGLFMTAEIHSETLEVVGSLFVSRSLSLSLIYVDFWEPAKDTGLEFQGRGIACLHLFDIL